MHQDNDHALLVKRAVEAGERQGCRDEYLPQFLTRYYQHTALEDLRDRDAVDLAGAALMAVGRAAPPRCRQRSGVHPLGGRARLVDRAHRGRCRH